MPEIELTKLQCITTDEIDKDELFIKYKDKKIWPTGSKYHQMDSTDVVNINLTIEHHLADGPLILELWDYDLISANDLLGTFEMKLSEDDFGDFSTYMKSHSQKSTAVYMLYWKIVTD